MFFIGLLCTVIKYKYCFQVQLCLQPLLSSLVLEMALYLVHQHFRRTKLGGTGWGCYIWCFSCRNREPDLLNHMWNHSPLKNMYKNTKTKSDTYAAWSLGSPAPPVCVAAGASTAALQDSREREKKETHQCKKQLKRHFQVHLVFFLGCQGNSKQQKWKEPTSHPSPLPHCNCRSGCQQSGFRILLWVTERKLHRVLAGW